jgi:hypothetical protein
VTLAVAGFKVELAAGVPIIPATEQLTLGLWTNSFPVSEAHPSSPRLRSSASSPRSPVGAASWSRQRLGGVGDGC